MRTGGAYLLLTDAGQITFLIPFSSLDSGNINSTLLPDADGTRSLGSPGLRWASIFTSVLYCPTIGTELSPIVDNTFNLGAWGQTWAEIYVNAIKGGAATQIQLWGLMGEK